MSLLLDLNPLLCLSITVLFFGIAHKFLNRETTAYDLLPWAGLPSGPLARIRGYLFSGGRRDRLLEAYEKVRVNGLAIISRIESRLKSYGQYSLHGKCFVWQGLRQAPVIVLPPSQTAWIIQQSESVLCNRTFFSDRQHTRSSLADHLPWEAIHVDIIRSELTRHLDSIIFPASDEIRATFEEHLGISNQWRSIELRKLMADIAIRVFNRSFGGVELARNEDIKHHLVRFTRVALKSASRLHACPALLRPLAGFFVLRPNRHHWKGIATHVLPIIDSRKEGIAHGRSSLDVDRDRPHDVLQSLILASLNSHDPANALSTNICARYIFTAVASINATALAATHAIFCLARMHPSLDVINILREEIIQVRDNYCPDGRWTQTTLARLVYLDSAIRESLRIGMRSGITATRTVVAAAGVTLNDGTFLPQGTHVALHALGAHFLNFTYADPQSYDPWRFVRSRGPVGSAVATKDGEEQNGAGASPSPSVTAATTSAEFLTFGIGRHACPGRFFVVAELKLVLIELLTRYDVQPLIQQPLTESASEQGTSTFNATLTMRRLSDEH